MRFWGNLVGYQLVWLVTVIGAGRGQWWPAVAAAAVFALWQLSCPGNAGWSCAWSAPRWLRGW